MCRAGGPRCRGGHSHSKGNQAARQRLSRANRAFTAAQTTGDPTKIEAAQQKLTKAQSEMEQVKQAPTHENPDQTRDVTTPGAPVSVADQIRDTVRAITQEPGRWGTLGWVNLATLRERLPHVDRADLDRVLDDLITDQDVYLMAELNQKVMTDQDRTAAVTIGGEDRHMIQFKSHQDPDPDALERVRRQGVANSSNADLAAALNTHGVGDELYAQIRDEETRRNRHTPPVHTQLTKAQSEMEQVKQTTTNENPDQTRDVTPTMSTPVEPNDKPAVKPPVSGTPPGGSTTDTSQGSGDVAHDPTPTARVHTYHGQGVTVTNIVQGGAVVGIQAGVVSGNVVFDGTRMHVEGRGSITPEAQAATRQAHEQAAAAREQARAARHAARGVPHAT